MSQTIKPEISYFRDAEHPTSYNEDYLNSYLLPQIRPELHGQFVRHVIDNVTPHERYGRPNVWLNCTWYKDDCGGLPQFSQAQRHQRHMRATMSKGPEASSTLMGIASHGLFKDILFASGIYEEENKYFLELMADGRLFRKYNGIIGSMVLAQLTPEDMQELDEKLTETFAGQFPHAFEAQDEQAQRSRPSP